MSIVYHPNPTRRDLLIRAYLPPPKYGPEDKVTEGWLPKLVPLFYVTVREDRLGERNGNGNGRWTGRFEDEMQTSRPELLLHEGGRASCRILAQGKFHPVTMSTDVTLSPASSKTGESSRGLSRATSHNALVRPATSPSDSGFEKPQLVLGKDDSGRPRLRIVRVCLRGGNGIFKVGRWGFEIETEKGREGERVREWFEWRKDKGNEKSDLWCGIDLRFGDGSTQKLKLVNARSGEVMAGFTRSEDDNGLGVFRFCGQEIGGEFDVLAVMSLLSIVERGRRRGSNRLSKAFKE